MTSITDFARFKADRRKISIVTAYDAWTARLVAASAVDAILVGDSAAMVVHGHPTTLPATVRLMANHVQAVARGSADKLVIADLPFLSHRQGIGPAIRACGALMRSGAHAVKLEGVDGHEDVIRHVVESGVPVMGHAGLTPQSVHRLGGFRVQGRNTEDADRLARQARALQDLGCFAIVLECVPADLAARITADLTVPTIGIGAGPGTDGQVLVFHDLAGLGTDSPPRFVRRYVEGAAMLTDALNRFDGDVKSASFPDDRESYR